MNKFKINLKRVAAEESDFGTDILVISGLNDFFVEKRENGICIKYTDKTLPYVIFFIDAIFFNTFSNIESLTFINVNQQKTINRWEIDTEGLLNVLYPMLKNNKQLNVLIDITETNDMFKRVYYIIVDSKSDDYYADLEINKRKKKLFNV